MKYSIITSDQLQSAIVLIHSSIDALNGKDYSQQEISAMKKYQNKESLQTKLNRGAKYFIAVDGDRIVGIGGIEEDSVSTVFVDPKYKGKGIGKAIMGLIENAALDSGITQIGLGSTITARGFYEKQGFYQVKEQFLELQGLKIKMYLMLKDLKD